MCIDTVSIESSLFTLTHQSHDPAGGLDWMPHICILCILQCTRGLTSLTPACANITWADLTVHMIQISTPLWLCGGVDFKQESSL